MTMIQQPNKPIFRLKTLSPEFEPGDIPVETDVYCDRSDWYGLEILEPCIHGFCSFEKPHYVPEEVLEAIGTLAEDGSTLVPCRCLARRELHLWHAYVRFKHEQNAFYPARGDFDIEQVVLEIAGWYCVGNRLKFHNLQHTEDEESPWEPIPAEAWKQNDVRFMKDGSVEADIYIVQKFENRILEVLRFMPEWRHLHFGRLCNPFFDEDEEERLKYIRMFRRRDAPTKLDLTQVCDEIFRNG